MKRRVFLIDDHPMLRIGLRKLLEESGRYIVSGEAETAAQALRGIERSGADCVIADIMLRGRNRTDLIRSLREAAPETPVIVLSTLDRREHEKTAAEAGAAAFIGKEESPNRLLDALAALFPPAPDGERSPRLGDLTPRERSVFDLLGTGVDKHEIASVLGISVKTVEAHREALKRKLDTPSMRDLVRVAVQSRQRN